MIDQRRWLRETLEIRRRLDDLVLPERPHNLVAPFLRLPVLRGLWATSVAGGPTSPAGGNLVDLSGNGLDLTLNGNPQFALDGVRPYVDLDGTGDFFARADTGANDPLDILGSEAYVAAALQGLTIGCWCYPDAYGNDDGLVTKGDPTSLLTCNYGLEQFTSVNRFRMVVGTGGSAVAASSASTTTGKWYFVVGRYETASQDIDVMVNGISSGTVATGVAALQNNTDPFNIGSYNSAAGYCLDGRIAVAFVCAGFLPDRLMISAYEQTRGLFGV